jgi:hypothetical protein
MNLDHIGTNQKDWETNTFENREIKYECNIPLFTVILIQNQKMSCAIKQKIFEWRQNQFRKKNLDRMEF